MHRGIPIGSRTGASLLAGRSAVNRPCKSSLTPTPAIGHLPVRTTPLNIHPVPTDRHRPARMASQEIAGSRCIRTMTNGNGRVSEKKRRLDGAVFFRLPERAPQPRVRSAIGRQEVCMAGSPPGAPGAGRHASNFFATGTPNESARTAARPLRRHRPHAGMADGARRRDRGHPLLPARRAPARSRGLRPGDRHGRADERQRRGRTALAGRGEGFHPRGDRRRRAGAGHLPGSATDRQRPGRPGVRQRPGRDRLVPARGHCPARVGRLLPLPRAFQRPALARGNLRAAGRRPAPGTWRPARPAATRRSSSGGG